MKKFFKICIYITLSVLSVMGIRLLCCDRLKIIPIEGKLGFTDTYIPDASTKYKSNGVCVNNE